MLMECAECRAIKKNCIVSLALLVQAIQCQSLIGDWLRDVHASVQSVFEVLIPYIQMGVIETRLLFTCKYIMIDVVLV